MMSSNKLTKAQERAKAKLTHEWQCAEELEERLPTLQALAHRGHGVMERDAHWPSAMYSPRAAIYFRLPGA